MKKHFLPLSIALLATGVLVLVVDDFIQQVLITPLLQVFWFVVLLITNIPQAFCWGTLVVITLLIAFLSVPRDKPIKPQDQDVLFGNRGAVAAWTTRLLISRESDFARRGMAQSLRKLSRNLMFPNEHISYHEFEAWLEHSSSALSPEIVAYFQAPMPETQPLFWPIRRSSDSTSRALGLDPEHVVAYLENRLDPLAGE